LFDAIQAPTTTYTPALGYLINNGPSLGVTKFNLAEATKTDEWGRPYYGWTYKTGDKATYFVEEHLTYYTAVTECQIAADAKLKKDTVYTVYTNGADNETKYNVQPTDTVGKLGAQGRLTEVYDDRIVMIDTLLATVEDVSTVKYDAAGHIKTYAKLTLKVYDDATPTTLVEESSTNWEYTKGQVLLVSAVQDDSSQVVKATGKDYAEYIEIQGVADSVVGTQTTIWVLANQHTINGTTYYDNNRLALNQAGTDSTKNYNWYFDAQGNVIGSKAIPATYTYGILKNMIWNVGTPGYATATLIDPATGAETTVTVNTLDGAQGTFTGWANETYTPSYTVDLSKLGFVDADDTAYVSNDSIYNGVYNGFGLYRVETLANGKVNLDGYNVISYRHATTITTNATYFVGEGGHNVYVDDATVFTVRVSDGKGGYTYQQYVGKGNVPSFEAGTVRAFYVDTDVVADGIADYVYIKEGTMTNAGRAFVVATAPTYKTMYEGSIQYDYLVNSIVGTEAKVDAVKATSASSYVRNLSARVDVPHYVTYGVDGALATIDPFDTTAENAYGSTYYVKLANPGYSETTLLYNKTAVDTPSYNTSRATVVGDYTSLDDVTVWANVNVYVVYDATTGFASTVYVFDKPDSEIDSSVTPDPTLAKVVYEIKVVDTYGVTKNIITAAVQTNTSALTSTGTTLQQVLDAMATPPAGWTNVDGAADLIAALGITGASSSTTPAFNCAPGAVQTVTFIVVK
ncbi:MAG: hypothetical protein ACI4O5_06160, partial [Oscillospiraceae bacterium]